MHFVPSKMYLTKGVGTHKYELRSFEMALRDAGIEKCNLVTVSSILPHPARDFLEVLHFGGIERHDGVFLGPEHVQEGCPDIRNHFELVDGTGEKPVETLIDGCKASQRQPSRAAAQD